MNPLRWRMLPLLPLLPLLLLGVACALSPRPAHAQYLCGDPVHYTGSVTIPVPSFYLYLDPRDPVQYTLYDADYNLLAAGFTSRPIYLPSGGVDLVLDPVGKDFGVSVFVSFCDLIPTPTPAPSATLTPVPLVTPTATVPLPLDISSDPLATTLPILAVLLGLVTAFALLIQIRR